MTTPMDTALNKPGQAWLTPQIHADWRSAGYAGDGSIDDLSDQAGNEYVVTQSMDDGLPDTVTVTTSVDASGTLDIPAAIGRPGQVLQRIRKPSTPLVTGSDLGNGTTTQGITPVFPAINALDCQLLWIAWRSVANGAGASAVLTQLPAGFGLFVPQITDGDFSAVLLIANPSIKADAATSGIPFYFSQAVDWMSGWIQLRADGKYKPQGSAGFDYLPTAILDAVGTSGGAPATSHSADPVTTGSTGSTGGSPQGIFLSFGAGGDWTHSVGDFQLSGSTAAGKINYAYAVNGAGGVTSTFNPGLGTFPLTALTSKPFGTTLQTLDGTFESGVSGWTLTSGTLAQSALQAHSGTKSGLLTVTGTPAQANFRHTQVAISTGGTYRASLWAFSTTGVSNIRVSIDWYDASHVFLSTSDVNVSLLANTWTRIDTGPVTAPASAAFAAWGGTIAGSPPTGRAVFFDDVDFRAGEVLMFSWSAEGVEYPDLDGRQYFSQHNAASPVYPLERDTAPMTVSQGVVTDSGPVYTQLFSGQMAGVRISGRTAEISGLSASRLALMANVTMPMVNGQTAGANMTWPITHALGQCGYYVAPAPTPYARAYFSMHGSLYPNMGDAPKGQPAPIVTTHYSDIDISFASGGTGQIDGAQPLDTPGPFMLAMFAQRTDNAGQLIDIQYHPFKGWWSGLGAVRDPIYTQGTQQFFDALSQANNIGRFSCWLRGDDFVNTPAGWTVSNSAGSFGGLMAHRIAVKNSSGTELGVVEVGIEKNDPVANNNFPYVIMADNHGHVLSVASGLVLPIDGNWHFVSWSWNWATGDCTVHMDTGTSTHNVGALTFADLPTTEAALDSAGGQTFIQMWSWLPIAECHLETGPTALYSSGYLWTAALFTATPFVPTAIVRALPFHLAAITDTGANAAWDTIVRYAQASLSSYRCDELDRPCFLPLTYFGEPLYQVVMSDRMTLRTVSNGFGTVDGVGGYTWTTSPAANTSVGSGNGSILLNTPGQIVSGMLNVSPVADLDFHGLFKPGVVATGGPIYADLRIRYVDSTHYILARMAFQTDNTIDAYVIANYGSGEVILAQNLATHITYDSGQYLWLRVEAFGSIVRMKFYNAQNIEDPSWLVVATDTAAQAGTIGIDAFTDATNSNASFSMLISRFQMQAEIIDVIDTDVDAQDLDITTDPSRIRNDATVQFTETSVSTLPTRVLGYQTAITLPPHFTTVTLALDTTQAQTITNQALSALTATQVTNGTFPANVHWMSVNTKPDGTGSYLTTSQVSALVMAVTPTSVTIRFSNATGKTAYVVNNNANGMPFLNILGYAVSAAAGYTSANDPASIALRGNRTVSSEIDGIQLRADAEYIAQALVSICANPRGTVQVHCMGDPRRAPGQRVLIADAQGTKADGYWLILSVSHNRSGAEFTQDLTLVQIYDTALWDLGVWDFSSWGL